MQILLFKSKIDVMSHLNFGKAFNFLFWDSQQ